LGRDQVFIEPEALGGIATFVAEPVQGFVVAVVVVANLRAFEMLDAFRYQAQHGFEAEIGLDITEKETSFC
jgi:hypothetical protein